MVRCFILLLVNILLLAQFLVIYGLSPSSPPPPPSPPSHLWKGSLTQSSYFYSDYKLPSKVALRRNFKPEPQKCPDTGDTICKEVEEYPIEQIYRIVSQTEGKNFNFTSEFVDESSNDFEPNLNFLKSQPTKSVYKGYIVYQTSLHYKHVPTPLMSKVHLPNSYPNQETMDYPSINWETTLPINTESQATHLMNRKGHFNSWRPVYVGRKRPAVLHRSLEPEKARPITARVLSKRQIMDKEEICHSQAMFITPRAALNDRSEWKYIVNLGERDPRLRQVIKVDLCSRPNGPCSSSISLPFGFISKCRQKYIKKKLLALDPNGQSTSNENFFVPSCCVCEIIRQ